MTKLILVKFILAALLVFPLFELTATTSPDRELTPEEIAIKKATSSVDPERERSLIPTVEAWLYRNTGEVEVIFNRDCGTANVTTRLTKAWISQFSSLNCLHLASISYI